MKTIIISIIAIIAILFFLAEMHIQFSPFKITFVRPYYAVGWILICIGIAFIQIDSEKKAKTELLNDIEKVIEEYEHTN